MQNLANKGTPLNPKRTTNRWTYKDAHIIYDTYVQGFSVKALALKFQTNPVQIRRLLRDVDPTLILRTHAVTFRDLTGMKFDGLTVIKYVRTDKANAKGGACGARFECLCACGTVKDILGYQLLKGQTKSCGCLRRQRLQK